MRILLIPGTVDGANLGDLAMLEIAMERLHRCWPSAAVVIPSEPGFSRQWRFRAEPVAVESWKHWGSRQRGSWKGWLPNRAALAKSFQEILEGADLVVLAGSGVLTDPFRPTVLRILATLRAAQERGIPTLVLGQGLGPVDDPGLREFARDVLGRVDGICLRDPGASAALLQEWGVESERCWVTGDDAVELAWRQAPAEAGSFLGVNVRVAGYSLVSQEFVPQLALVLRRAADRLQTALLGIPISNGEADSDIEALGGFMKSEESGAQMSWTTDAVIERAGRCRVVVAGSYHAAVFALSQGVPVIALAQSPYYVAKFGGLARQFGAGCRILSPGSRDFEGTLTEAIEGSWAESDELRPMLLGAAARQVDAGRAAFARIARCSERLQTTP